MWLQVENLLLWQLAVRNSLKNKEVEIGEELLQEAAHSEVMLTGKISQININIKRFQKLSLSAQQFHLQSAKFPSWRRIPTLIQKPFEAVGIVNP